MGVPKITADKKENSDSIETPLILDAPEPSTTVKIEGSSPAESRGIQRFKITVYFIVLIISLLCATSVILLWCNRPVTLPALPALREYCCSCEHMNALLLDEHDLKITVEESEGRKRRCCASTEQGYMYMMKAMLNNPLPTEREQILSEKRIHGLMTKNVTITLLHQSPVAAHVLISTHNSEFQNLNQYNEMKDPPPVRNLLPNRSTSLLREVSLERDRLIIKTAGLYLIYSQVYFKVIQGTNWHKGVTFLSHIVDRYNDRLPNGGEQKLLQNIHTLPQRSRSNDPAIDFHTSYISGVFKLNAHDEIYARVTNQDFLSRDPIMSFIGLVKID